MRIHQKIIQTFGAYTPSVLAIMFLAVKTYTFAVTIGGL